MYLSGQHSVVLTMLSGVVSTRFMVRICQHWPAVLTILLTNKIETDDNKYMVTTFIHKENRYHSTDLASIFTIQLDVFLYKITLS